MMIVGNVSGDRHKRGPYLGTGTVCGVLVADLHHFLDMPDNASGSARSLARQLGDIVRAGTAGAVGEPWVAALPCRRRPAHRRCPRTDCDDDGMVSNWADTAYDLRRRRLNVVGEVDEFVVTDTTAGVLRELVMLDLDCERLVFGMRAHPDGAILLASADDLEELIGFVAAEANHEPNRRRRQRLDAAFIALTEAAPNPVG